MTSIPNPLDMSERLSERDSIPVTDGGERIRVLDVLRGFALLGMVLVHFHDHADDAKGLGAAFGNFVDLFVATRAYTVFAILFGVGFAVQLRRADARGERFAARFLRRLFALFCFGLVAEWVFGYHVLVEYAVWGAPLMLVRRWSTRALVIFTLLCACTNGLFPVVRGTYRTLAGSFEAAMSAAQATQAQRKANFEAFEQARQSTDFVQVFKARVQRMSWWYAQPYYLLPGYDFTFFLLGMLALRLGYLERPREHRTAIVGVMIFGVLSWALSNWVLPFPGPDLMATSPLAHGWLMTARNGVDLLRGEWLAFVYIGGMLLLVAANPVWLDRFSLFGTTGRMALTNYFIQIAVLSLWFDKYALGRSISALMVPVAALLLFAVEVAFSRWWLTRYRFGPLEWVWRTITYWRRQPFHKTAAATIS